MIKTALIYGGISGAITISSIMLGLLTSDGHGAGASVWFGYLIMIVALTLIFVGTKRYRDRELGGVIKFGPAFGLGLMIAAVAGAIYVLVWEVYLNSTDYAFIHDYTDGILAAKEAAGVAGAELEAAKASMVEMIANYDNPLYRLPMTFAEIFPVGLVVALISAAVLRNPKILPARG